MNTRLMLLIVLLLVVIGVVLGRYTVPQKVITKTVTEVKTVTVVQHDTVVVTKEITKPDGTKEIDTITTDKSVDTTHSDDKQDTTKIVSTEKPQWKVSAQFTPKNPALGYFYGAQIDRRILGPIFVGGFGNTDKTLGLSVGLEF